MVVLEADLACHVEENQVFARAYGRIVVGDRRQNRIGDCVYRHPDVFDAAGQVFVVEIRVGLDDPAGGRTRRDDRGYLRQVCWRDAETYGGITVERAGGARERYRGTCDQKLV